MRLRGLARALLLLCLLGAVLQGASGLQPALAEAGRWGTAELIGSEHPDVSPHPQVVVDDSGCATAVWSYFQGTNAYVLARRCAKGGTWEREVFLGAGSGASAPYEPRVAAAPGGNLVAVWQQSDETGVSICANRYLTGSGWGAAAQRLGTAAVTGEDGYPQAAIDAIGRAVAVWSADGRISARACSVSGTWGEIANIEDSAAGPASQAQVAMDSSGNALAVWRQGQSGASRIYAARYDGTGWSSPLPIDAGGGTAAAPRLAMDAAGKAAAVWEQSGGAATTIGACRYTGTAWGDPAAIGTGAGSAAAPRVAVGAGDDAVAVWQQSDGGVTRICASRGSGTAWDGAVVIEAEAGAGAAPRVGMDAGGDALAVWQQFDGTATSVRASRHDGTAWSTPAAIETSAATAGGAGVAAGLDGTAAAVWWQSDAGQKTVWSNRYTVDSGPQPAIYHVLPPRATAGNSLEVLIRGANFTGASSVSFGDDVAVDSFAADNATHLRATIFLAPTAAPGPRDVEVVTPAGAGTLEAGFQVLTVPALAAEEPAVSGSSLVPTFAGTVTDPEESITAVQYRVDGGQWQTTTLERNSDDTSLGRYSFATLLPPGRHTVEIRGTDSGGDAVSEVATLSLTVGPGPSRARVFVLAGAAVAVVAAAGAYLVWRRRRRPRARGAGPTRVST